MSTTGALIALLSTLQLPATPEAMREMHDGALGAAPQPNARVFV
jgi:hypothetical protein